MKDLTAANFDEVIYDDCEPCLVLFSRKTCHVCKEVHPMLEEIEQDYEGKDFHFYHVDVEEQSGLFGRFALKGVPQVLFFKDGEFAGKITGKKDEEEYTDKIDEIIGE